MPKVFLCHSSQDKEFVRKLADDLNARGLQHWFDEREILVGDQVRAKIEEGIKESDFLAVVLSPASVASQWVSRELDAKLLEEIQSKRVTVLPILYKECEIPPLLTGKHYADFRKNYDAGIKELAARFAKSEKEPEIKRQVLARLTKAPPERLDPHLLMQLALTCGQPDAAEELAQVHEIAHPDCGLVTAIHAAVSIINFNKDKKPKTFIAALNHTFSLCMKNPAAVGNVQNLNNLAASGVNDRKITTVAFELLSRTLTEIQRNEATIGIASAMINIVHRMPRTNEENIRLCQICLDLMQRCSTAALRPFISTLIHTLTHLCDTLPTQAEKRNILEQISSIGSSKVENSSEYSDAFLHLAWNAAKRHKTRDAKQWLAKYKLTVPNAKYSEALQKHPPLSEL